MSDEAATGATAPQPSTTTTTTTTTFLTAKFPELEQLELECGKVKIESYEALHKLSVEHNDKFWSVLAKSRLDWFQTFDEVRQGAFTDNLETFQLKWFLNGKLNVSVNCVDRHYAKNPNKIALIWDKDEPGQQEYVTYEQLYELMNKIANMMKAFDVKKGDRVAIYMPCCTMTVAVMLACARIGAVHSVVFAGFSAESLASRINDSECKVVFTANQGLRGGKAIELKKTVDAALEKCASVKNVFVYKRTENAFSLNKDRDIVIDDNLNKYSSECTPEIMDSEDPLFMLYTSGSTGKPKGLIHTQAGYLLQVALTHQMVFNYNSESNDVFGCLADVGWITGHSYVVYGPLCNGGTTVLFESTPIYPDPGRYWETVDRLKINQLYLAPTSLRLLIKYGDEWVKKYSRASLTCLGSVGEPINHEAWEWYYEVVGEKRCKIADTWWQTETGSHMITPLPCNKNDELKPSMAMRPFLGITPCILHEKGHELEGLNGEGVLCIRNPWPSMARTIYGDHKRFIDTYLKPYPGYYFTGDGSLTDKDGHFQITGRVDDVINVSGHRIGTAEIEDALDEHELVAESAVVSFPHDIYGEGIFAFVILKESSEATPLNEADLANKLKLLVKSKIAHYAMPHEILFTVNLPKTRSGKIMRRILRKIVAENFDDLGDVTTLSDPSVVDDIVKKYMQNKNNKTSTKS